MEINWNLSESTQVKRRFFLGSRCSLRRSRSELADQPYLIADKGYGSEDLRHQVRERNGIPVIPRKRNSKVGNDDIDWHLYKYRHLVKNAFARLKHFRSIATRYDKL